jgi:molybdate transport system substrate-binding protein
MRRISTLLMLFLASIPAWIPGAAPAGAQEPVRVAAAADLEPVLPGILGQFQLATGIHVDAVYQSSATLTGLIENGAPFDLFLSADLDYPKKLIKDGLTDGTTPQIYARGTLVLWTRKDSGLAPSLTERAEDLLRNPALKRLAIANPDRAPYGRAAVAALRSMKLYDALAPRLVTAENIAQAAQFADTGNADAGLISLTSARTPRMSGSGRYFEIPHALYPPIEQGAVVLKRSTQSDRAHRLLGYLLSGQGQAQLSLGGLTAVQ